MVKKLLIVLFGILAALSIAETYLRIAVPADQPSPYTPVGNFPCYRQGTYYWADIKSNATCVLHSNYGEFADITVHTNKFGQRNRDISDIKPQGAKRILFIGDSFTFGWGVEENLSYPRISEQILMDMGYPVESINAGRPSNTIGNYYLYLKNEGLKFNPDIVVIGLDVFNDIANIMHHEHWIHVERDGLPTQVTYPNFYVDREGNLKNGIAPSWFSHLYLLRFLATNVSPTRRTALENDEMSQEVGLNKLKLVFDAIQKMLREQNKHLIVFMIPSVVQVDTDVRRSNGLPQLVAGANPLDDDVMAYFDRNQIDYLNVLPDFQRSPVRNNLYYKKDGHWTKEGQQAAAALLSAKLVQYLQK